jgi:hypothetical protein
MSELSPTDNKNELGLENLQGTWRTIQPKVAADLQSFGRLPDSICPSSFMSGWVALASKSNFISNGRGIAN